MTPLHVSDLTVVRGARTVVDRLSLSAAVGEVTALIGPNGSGKSSALKAMLGLLPATGAVRLGDEDALGLAGCERARRIAYVPQRTQLASAMVVADVVACARFVHVGGFARLGGRDRAVVDDALRRTDAMHLARRRFAELSTGEQQRVLVARAIATGAGCILMDEPTAALDVGHALAMLDLVRALARSGRTLVVVLHHLDEVRRVADRAVLLDHGRTIASGGVADVLAPQALRAAFGVEPVAGGALGFRLSGSRAGDRPGSGPGAAVPGGDGNGDDRDHGAGRTEPRPHDGGG